jgi:hypothetical protein
MAGKPWLLPLYPCLPQVFPTDALSSSLGEGAAAAHLRSKEALLALLHERVMDKVSAAAVAAAHTAAGAAAAS